MSTPLLEARDVVKTYAHVEALRGANFTVNAGEVVALIGDNGAGKSTLIKCLSGVTRPTSGQILVDGEPVEFHTPDDAQHAGIQTVYQDLALATDLDPAENLYLGKELLRGGVLGRLGVLDRKVMTKKAAAHFEQLGVRLKDAGAPVAALSGGQQQSIAVARASAWATKVVFLDEPTAALGVVQTKRVLELVRRIRDGGMGVVLISHNMPDVLATADRIEVLRLGRRVAQLNAHETDLNELVAAMTGAREESGSSA